VRLTIATCWPSCSGVQRRSHTWTARRRWQLRFSARWPTRACMQGVQRRLWVPVYAQVCAASSMFLLPRSMVSRGGTRSTKIVHSARDHPMRRPRLGPRHSFVPGQPLQDSKRSSVARFLRMGAQTGCRRSSAKERLGSPLSHHEIEDTLRWAVLVECPASAIHRPRTRTGKLPLRLVQGTVSGHRERYRSSCTFPGGRIPLQSVR
jgi:hypothetical protein